MKRAARTSAVAVLWPLLIALVAGCFWFGWSARRAVLAAESQLGECLQLAGRIAAIRSAPDKAEEATRGHEELAQLIERWSRAAEIDPQQIISVTPVSPRRLADSDYQEAGAEIDLAGVTLRQLAAFADHVAAADEQLVVSSLRLQSPREQASDGTPEETWNAEIALTYLVFSPRSASR